MSRKILITGGSGKFGRLLIPHFLELGDFVITNSRNEVTASEMNKKYGKNFFSMKCDFRNENAIPSFVNELSERDIYPDCLVNNARSVEFLGIQENGAVSRENFSNEFLLDVIVPYELTIALAANKDSELSKVVNVGSQYGCVTPNLKLYEDPTFQSPLHYGVCKAALNHLTKELAVRLADKGIQVNCIAYGGVEGRVDDEFKKRYANLSPTGRMLMEDEVAGPVEALLSGKMSAMTGHILNVDGGWGLW